MDRELSTPDTQSRSGPGFARREFLKGTGAAVAATALATEAAEAQEKAKKKSSKVVSGPTKLSLNVNGKATEVTVEPRDTLLDVLRNQLNLTGAKDLGDNYTVGADTVLIDGKAAFASQKLAFECDGVKITTVESLHSATKTDPVVTAFCKHDAMQCGFCTPGFVMAVRGFLNQNPKATLDDCRKGLGGNLCRCGTYDGVLHAAFEVAQNGGA